ncbi:MAG: helix-turn-helix domain-containing protein [Clostridia bacterium]|nr:helix-turn-helix domain-containing protein [Clostridia bacterium]
MGKQTMGEFLALLRRANGFTQQEVADKLNISNRTLSSWETDRTTPDILLLPSIADLYGVTVDELLRCEKCANDSSDNRLSEAALRAQRKHRFGKYSAKSLLLSCLGCFGAVLLALAFVFILYTSCPMWLFILLVVLASCDMIVCAAVLFYCLYNVRLAEGLVLNEDYTKEKRAYALALRSKTAKFFLFCALPLIAFALITLIVFFAAEPQYVYVGGITIDYSETYYVAMGICGGFGVLILVAYIIYANLNFKSLANEKQSENHRHNSKLIVKTVGFGAIPVFITLVLMIVFIYVYPREVDTVYFTANSVEEVKQKFQTIHIDNYEANLFEIDEGDYYLNFNTDDENKITFSSTDYWGNTDFYYVLYDLGNGFYGRTSGVIWQVYHLDDKLPPEQMPENETLYSYFSYVASGYSELPVYSPTSDYETAVNVAFSYHDTMPVLEGPFIYKQEINLWYYVEDGFWRYELDVWRDFSVIFLGIFLGTTCATVLVSSIIYLAKHKKQSFEF